MEFLSFGAVAPALEEGLRPARLTGGVTVADTVSIPDQLRDPAGTKKLKELLRNSFARSRRLQLHCIKLACCWPDHKTPYANLLGNLVTSGDVEALGYQWQGQADKAQTANKLLKQASLTASCLVGLSSSTFLPPALVNTACHCCMFVHDWSMQVWSVFCCRQQTGLCRCLRHTADPSIWWCLSAQILILMRRFKNCSAGTSE